MKNLFLRKLMIFSCLTLLVTTLDSFAAEVSQTSPTIPQNISFNQCTKIFNIKKDKLFYLTLSGITENNFTINEIQSNYGYVIFSVAKRQYLATVISIDNMNSMLKISPCNNNYIFPPGILTNMYKYIELNLNKEVIL